MPATVSRLFERLRGGARIGAGSNSASNSYTEISTAGYQVMSGCARVYKDIHLRPRDFQGIEAGTASQFGSTGSAYGGSILAAVGSCALSWSSGSLIKIQTIVASGASVASPTNVYAYFPRPTDADTTGSIICNVDWTYGDPAAAGSKVTMFAGLAYFGTGSSMPRTAASVGAACAASYGATACGLYETACLGKFPSFHANDRAVGLYLAWGGASAAAGQGQMISSCVHILGVRLRYVACALGVQVSE